MTNTGLYPRLTEEERGLVEKFKGKLNEDIESIDEMHELLEMSAKLLDVIERLNKEV